MLGLVINMKLDFTQFKDLMPSKDLVMDPLGNKYKTVKDLCRAHDINIVMLYLNLLDKQPLKEAILRKYRHSIYFLEYRYDSTEIYKSYKDLSQRYNLDNYDLTKLIKQGYTLVDIVNKVKKDKDILAIKEDNDRISIENIDSIYVYNVSFKDYMYRILHGESVEQALENDRNLVCLKDNRTKYIDTILSDDTWRPDIGREYEDGLLDVDTRTIVNNNFKIREIKLSDESLRGLEEAVFGNSVAYIDSKGSKFYSLDDLCRAYNIPKYYLSMRIKNGLSVEEALNIGLEYGYTVVKDPAGKFYKNRDEMLAAYKVTEELVNYRMSNGWSLKSALNAPVLQYKTMNKNNNLINKVGLIEFGGKRYDSLSILCKQYDIRFIDCIVLLSKGDSFSKIIDLLKSAGKRRVRRVTLEGIARNENVAYARKIYILGDVVFEQRYLKFLGYGPELIKLYTGYSPDEQLYKRIKNLKAKAEEVKAAKHLKRVGLDSLENLGLGSIKKRLDARRTGNKKTDIDDTKKKFEHTKEKVVFTNKVINVNGELLTFKTAYLDIKKFDKYKGEIAKFVNLGMPSRENRRLFDFRIKNYGVIDNKGRKFNDIDALCNANGVNREVFIRNIDKGYTLNQALYGINNPLYVGEVRDQAFTDFKDLRELCEHYKLSLKATLIELYNEKALRNIINSFESYK